MLTFLKKLRRDERGVSALEYAILAAIVVLAVVAGTTGLKDKVVGVFSEITEQLPEAE